MREKRRKPQDADSQQEKNSTVQPKKSTNTKPIPQPSEQLFHSHVGWEEGKHPKIRTSNSAYPKSHKVRSAHIMLPTSKGREMKAEGTSIYCSPPPTWALFTDTPSHLKTFTFMLQRNCISNPLTTHHTDNIQGALHFEDRVWNCGLKKEPLISLNCLFTVYIWGQLWLQSKGE